MAYDQKRVVDAIRAFEAGEIVVVTDDDGRENEGDLIVAAVHCTADKMAFIVRHTSGIVCTPMTREDARRLNLAPMVADNDSAHTTAFTVSVDFRHGTSTGMNDRSESAATRAVFGDEVKRLAVSSTKSSMGHLIAAAGAAEIAVCALAIQRGEMPVNANYRVPDPDCDLNFVLGAPRRQRVRMAMSNSFGFGGSNSCVVLRHPELVDGLAGGPR